MCKTRAPSIEVTVIDDLETYSQYWQWVNPKVPVVSAANRKPSLNRRRLYGLSYPALFELVMERFGYCREDWGRGEEDTDRHQYEPVSPQESIQSIVHQTSD